MRDHDYDDRADVAPPDAAQSGAPELERMAQRLREVDELSQFLVAMRDAVRTIFSTRRC